MTGIMIISMVPPKDYARVSSYTGVAFILAMVLGPLVGGGICEHKTWRWIFLFNVPIGAFAMALAFMSIPNGYPNHNEPVTSNYRCANSSELMGRVDFVGSLLLLLATRAFTCAFQEVNSQFTLHSAYFITLVIASAMLTAALLFWNIESTTPTASESPSLPGDSLCAERCLDVSCEYFSFDQGSQH